MNNVKNNKSQSIWQYIVIIVILCLSFAIPFVMGYIQWISGTGDWGAHLLAAWGDIEMPHTKYGMISLVIRFFHLFSESWIPATAAVSCIVVMTIPVGAGVIRLIVNNIRPEVAFLLSFLAYIVMPVYIPQVNTMMGVGVQGVGIWHNFTYLAAKLFVAVCLFFYIRLQNEDGKNRINYIGLSIGFFLGTWAKPNLFLCFGAALFIESVVLLLLNKKNRRHAVFSLMTLIPSILMLLLQYAMVYGAGKQDDGGMAIMPLYTLNLGLAEHPWVGILQSLLFPILILFMFYKLLKSEQAWRFAWLATVIAYLQFLLLVETGFRMDHGNWTWGTMMTNYALFLLSTGYFYREIKEGKRKIILFAGGAVYIWHIVSAVIYMIRCILERNLWI